MTELYCTDLIGPLALGSTFSWTLPVGLPGTVGAIGVSLGNQTGIPPRITRSGPSVEVAYHTTERCHDWTAVSRPAWPLRTALVTFPCRCPSIWNLAMVALLDPGPDEMVRSLRAQCPCTCNQRCKPRQTIWTGMTDPLAEDAELMWRLARYMAAHPEVMIGREWRARIPLPRGARDIVCGSLHELLDELEKIAKSPRSARRGPRAPEELS